jgi:hypothetical protein
MYLLIFKTMVVVMRVSILSVLLFTLFSCTSHKDAGEKKSVMSPKSKTMNSVSMVVTPQKVKPPMQKLPIKSMEPIKSMNDRRVLPVPKVVTKNIVPIKKSGLKEHRIQLSVKFSSDSHKLKIDKVYLTKSAVWVTAKATIRGLGYDVVTKRSLGVTFSAPNLPIKRVVYGYAPWRKNKNSMVQFFKKKKDMNKIIGKSSIIPHKTFKVSYRNQGIEE